MCAMGTKKKTGGKTATYADRGEYHLRLPKDLNEWLRRHAEIGGFLSEQEVVRHALRELKNQTEAQAA